MGADWRGVVGQLAHPPADDSSRFASPLDPRALETGRTRPTARRRGVLVRRLLLAADVVGLSLAFLLAEILQGGGGGTSNALSQRAEILLFLATLPGWLVLARVYRLYDRDEERTDHSTVDDFVGVFHLVTVSVWLFFIANALTTLAEPDWPKLVTFWALAIVLVPLSRITARAAARRSAHYLQNTLIVGAGDVGQLVARKLLSHPEYGLSLVGFVDAEPKERREDLGGLRVLGTPEDLPGIVERFEVERVIVAFSNDSHSAMLSLVRRLKELDIQVDIVPRLFEIVGPRVEVNAIEGLQLIGLPPVRLTRSALLLKRMLDVVVSASLLVLLSPLFVFIAWRIRRGSPGPVFFRQTRLGQDMREFTVLKFRTMHADTADDVHRDYIKSTMDWTSTAGADGLYKLERREAVTPTGGWLRRTSLDELPQLINILRGDMSLVGPRPCLRYETENFAAHHFERFLVPAGLTGLWQVKARARSTFGEALDMDVAYARSWSFGLDLQLLCLTPLQLLRPKSTL